MPHKMNTRSSERVNGLAVIVRGYLSMVGELAGDQWNEGDVSCSVVRRVALPDAFFAADGLFQTFLTVLDEFGAYPAVIARELDRYLPFLATTKILVGGGPRGRRPRGGARGDQGARGRGGAGHAGEGRRRQRPLRPAGRRRPARPDPAEIDALVADRAAFVGAAPAQVEAVADRVAAIVAEHPEAATYAPGADPLMPPWSRRARRCRSRRAPPESRRRRRPTGSRTGCRRRCRSTAVLWPSAVEATPTWAPL